MQIEGRSSFLKKRSKRLSCRRRGFIRKRIRDDIRLLLEDPDQAMLSTPLLFQTWPDPAAGLNVGKPDRKMPLLGAKRS
jgi:hypothetical protein